ncbi:MAG: hypothetical protein DHS20C15_02600 [Planctomycetota bacterium]|nr:MAG: hypothetical protein DHS20C15_02600 [Planctomycetota bacterium]
MNTQHPSLRKLRGFTLLEVMIAMAIMGFVMTSLYMSIEATLRTQKLIDHEVQEMKQGPRIIELLQRDLHGAYLLDIEGDLVFKGDSRTMLGESADSLTLLTTVDSTITHRVDDREVAADLCETGYKLRTHPEIPDLLQLWRRQTFFIDEKPFEGGSYELVYDRVIAFQLRYFDSTARDAEPTRDWDSEERRELPKLVSLRLEIEVGERIPGATREEGVGLRNLRYDRILPLARDSDLTFRVHALPPVFAEAANQAGAAAGGQGGQGGPGGQGGAGGGGDADAAGAGLQGVADGNSVGNSNIDPGSGNGGGTPGTGGGGGGGGGGAGQTGGGNGNGGGDVGNNGGEDIDLGDLLDGIFG